MWDTELVMRILLMGEKELRSLYPPEWKIWMFSQIALIIIRLTKDNIKMGMGIGTTPIRGKYGIVVLR
ncbi:hypothetical protein BHU16_08765 [Tannerella sp. oral taxon 808]|nr:hypothetical protein BHU16_08765 [Tannerella sp. oral taxon 808]